MKTIIAGGRSYRFSQSDVNALNLLKDSIPISEVVCGCQTGADTEGEKWAISHGIPVKRIEPDWNQWGKRAGPMRNRQMAEYADVLVAFPGGSGTLNMKRQAKELGLKTYIRNPTP